MPTKPVVAMVTCSVLLVYKPIGINDADVPVLVALIDNCDVDNANNAPCVLPVLLELAKTV